MTHQARAHHVEVIMTEEDPRIRGEALPVAGDDGAYKRQDTMFQIHVASYQKRMHLYSFVPKP